MPLSIAHGNGIKNFRAVTKIDALIWGAQAASLLFSAAGRKASAKIGSSRPFCRRQAADDGRLAACASQNLTRSDVTKKGARWRTSGRAILILFVAD
jgi:hypothetical protein